jgi:hypothetical protein
VSIFKPRTWGDKRTSIARRTKGGEVLFSVLAAGKYRIGHTLLWAITASNKVVALENAETFFIPLITTTASSKIIAWVTMMLFITQR